MRFRDAQVNLNVRDVETSARFYSELFGFQETFRTPKSGAPAHVELQLDRLKLGLASIAALREVHGVVTSEGPPRAEVVVWTDDVDQAFATLTAKGAQVLSAPHDFLDHLRAAWISDPDGHPVQIVARR